MLPHGFLLFAHASSSFFLVSTEIMGQAEPHVLGATAGFLGGGILFYASS